MEEGWTCVYSVADEFHALLIKEILEDHDLPASLINKKDNNAFLIGDYEVYVPSDVVVRAIQIIKASEI
jgi:hypothetical protein